MCLSQDAEYEKKTISVMKDDMKFSLKANTIIKEGFLAFGTTDRLRTRQLPPINRGDHLTLQKMKMHTKLTPEPPKLT